MPELQPACTTSRGQLTPEQIELLDEHLAYHGFAPSSPHRVPATVAAVCLSCGSISVASTEEQRNLAVANFDLTCCGLTVTFHSDHAVLVDVAILNVITKES